MRFVDVVLFILKYWKGHEWVTPFSTLDIKRVMVNPFVQADPPSFVSSGVVYRDTALSDTEAALMKELGVLCSSMLALCHLCAQAIVSSKSIHDLSPGNVVNILEALFHASRVDQETEKALNSIRDHFPPLYKVPPIRVLLEAPNYCNSIQGHLDSGAGTCMSSFGGPGLYTRAHFLNSSYCAAPKMFTYAYAGQSLPGQARLTERHPLRLTIKLSDTFQAATTGYEDDCVLPPCIPVSNIVDVRRLGNEPRKAGLYLWKHI